MEKKITKKEMFASIITIVEATEATNKEELVNFLKHEIELLEKRSSRTTPTKTQKENEGILQDILTSLAAIGSKVTVTELQSKAPALEGLSNQKISSLLAKLVKDGSVERVMEKKKAYFFLAESNPVEE